MPGLIYSTIASAVVWTAAAAAAPFAYVPNEGSASISVIDTATDRVTATLKLAQKPRGIAVSLDGSRLFISDQTANALITIDLGKPSWTYAMARGSASGFLFVGDKPNLITFYSLRVDGYVPMCK